MEHNYKCVMCSGWLQPGESDTLICGTCGRRYPVINGVAILIGRHKPALFSIGRYIALQHTQFNNLKASLSKSGCLNHSDTQVDNMLLGMQGNLQLMEQHCKPIVDYLHSQKYEPGNVDWFFAMDSGRSYHYMLRYLYQDWYGEKYFSQVKNLIADAVSAYCDDNESVSVLGCGACGLLYHLAKRFSVSYGLDLAIPTLMTAQQLFKGEDITIYLEAAEWKKIHLKAPEKAAGQTNLAACNVMHLPFEDSSLSVVVTQYMMDLKSNHPGHLTNEIHRVLKPNGIWINFSIPFRVPGDISELGPIKVTELPTFFDRFGFKLLCNEQQRFKPWNFEAVTKEGHWPDHEVHFYVAKKVNASKDQKVYVSFSDYFANKSEAIWNFTPQTLEERTVTVVNKTEFRASGVHFGKTLNVDFSKEVSNSFSIGNEQAEFIETVFKLINGKRPLHEIYSFMLESGVKLTEDEFIEFFHALSIYYYLISFQEIEND